LTKHSQGAVNMRNRLTRRSLRKILIESPP
jgi:hypothetical protein